MSHFAGLVAITPKYDMTLEECLEKYDEQRDVPEYIREEISNYDKVVFLNYYCNKQNEDKEKVAFVKAHEGEEGYKSKEDYENDYGLMENERYVYFAIRDHEEEFADYWIALHKDLFENFEEKYKEHGHDWNDNSWRVNPETNKWCDYTTYNPDSKWDWYDESGRWSEFIKTKSGEYVNECLVEEIDWSPFKPEDYCKRAKKDWRGNKYYPLKSKVRDRFTSDDVPFCIVVDGEWIERGSMGWWCMVTDEKDKNSWNEEFMKIINSLPEGTEIYNIDFHI